jgi:hypothetical protein
MKPPDHRAVAFAPLAAPRVVMDLELGRPVLLIGHWVNAEGLAVEAEVMTMGSRRSLLRIHEIALASHG